MDPTPAWNILQVDVSTYCTLHCPTCPRTTFIKHWRNAHISREVIETLLPQAHRFRLIHLQGWGEPLLHPELPSIIQAFTQAGAPCGLTTNGMQLSLELGKQLVQAGLKTLTVSLSGANPDTQARLRPSSNLAEILDNVRRFKIEAGDACSVRLSFLRQPENQHEMAKAVALADRLGLDGILGVNPTYLPTPDHAAHLVTPQNWSAWATLKARIVALFRRQACTMVGVEPNPVASCLNRPQENLTVAVDGGVSPCVFLQLPLKSSPPGFDQPLLCFGNVLEQDLRSIWNKPEYQAFREIFIQREQVYDTLAQKVAQSMWQGDSLEEFKKLLPQMDASHPLPNVCRGCLKAQGL